MTHLPLEDRNVVGWSGERYEIPNVCAHPRCSVRYGLEVHHLWRRSFLGGGFNWVKLPDERVVGNVIRLCQAHHQAITENKALVRWAGFPTGWSKEGGHFRWEDSFESVALSPQPPRASDDFPEENVASLPEEAIDAADEFTEPHSGVPEGSECPTCLRRVPKKRKQTTPESKVVSFRLPVANAPEWEEIIEAAAKHAGVYEETYWKWRVIERGLVLLLQEPVE